MTGAHGASARRELPLRPRLRSRRTPEENIARQRCQSIILWLTMSIDTRFFGSTAVAAMFHVIVFYCPGCKGCQTSISPMILFVRCRRCANILLPIRYIDRQRCRSINRVIGNGHGRALLFRTHHVWTMDITIVFVFKIEKRQL